MSGTQPWIRSGFRVEKKMNGEVKVPAWMLVALVGAVIAGTGAQGYAALAPSRGDVAPQVAANTTKIAVLETQIVNLKEQVTAANGKLDELLRRVQP